MPRRLSGAPSARARLRRHPERGSYDRQAIDAILDEALVAHVGFVHDGQPYVIPVLHARVGDELYLHGASSSRMVRALSAGGPACATVTLLDGLVVARSLFESSANYRSVVVLGEARAVTEPAEKLVALEAFSERLLPGRPAEVRGTTATELKATGVVAMRLDEASAKVRSGPPEDGESPDAKADVWAGVVPLSVVAGDPVPDPTLRPGIPVPASVRALLDGPARRGAR